MLIKYRPILLLFLFLLLFVHPKSGLAQTKSFYWERYDIDITLLPNGDMRFVETQTLQFSGGTFSNGYVSIPTGLNGQNEGITDIRVSEGDRQYSESFSQTPGTFQVTEESDEVFIDWYFEPTTGSHTYTIHYTVKGGVIVGTSEQGDGDQIYWKAIPADHPGTVRASTVTIRLPDGIKPQVYEGTNNYLVAGYVNGVESNQVDIQASEDGETITYRLNETLALGETFEVRVQFPHGLLAIPEPQWQAEQRVGDSYALVIFAISALLLVGGPLAVLLLWYVYGRDPELNLPVPEYLSEPPDNLPPAVVGTLVDEKADMRDVLSILVHLAESGYLMISEGENQSQTFTLTDKAWDGLRPFERQFISDFFAGSQERSLDSLRYKFASKLPRLRQMLYEELAREELVPQSPEKVRTNYGCLAGFLFITAIFGFFGMIAVLPEAAIGAAFCPPIALGITAVFVFVVSFFMPVKTAKGVEAAAQWRAFKNYLQNIDKYQNLNEAGEIFGKYLSYAVAFGLERTWINKFAALPGTPVPPWYRPYPRPYGYGPIFTAGSPGGGVGSSPSTGPGGLQGMSNTLSGGLQNMSNNLTRMLNNTATTLKSVQPSSSSSGRGFSGSSSRGFSGGSFRSSGGGSRGFR